MSGNHRRKRRDQWVGAKNGAAYKLICMIYELGIKSARMGVREIHSYCLRIYEAKRREQRL